MNKAKVIKSLIYKFIERFSVKSIGLVISIIQARLLAPEVFGQLSLLLVFTDLSLTVVDGGLNSALVQSKEVKERDYSTVFIITLGLTAVMIVLLYFAAPLIAGYYQSPALIMPLRIYSLSMFFSAFNSIQVARMQREMRFREMMYCSLAATLTAGTLGIAMASTGAGLWALVGYYFSHIAVTCIAMFCTDRWIPRGKFSKDSAKRLYGFGIKMLASSMITTIYNDIRPLIIGKKFSTADLGYYERGQRFSTTVSRNLDTAVQSVMFPVMAQAQDDKKQVRAMLRRAQTMGEFVIFPAMVGGAAMLADGVLTPAVTVTTAVEGLRTIPVMDAFLGAGQTRAIILTLAIILALFLVQRAGTSRIGKAFGSVMPSGSAFSASPDLCTYSTCRPC